MQSFDEQTRAGIRQRIVDATHGRGRVEVQSFNYDFSVGIAVFREDGRQRAWTAGLLNRPDPDEPTVDWRPVIGDLPSAEQAAIDFLNA